MSSRFKAGSGKGPILVREVAQRHRERRLPLVRLDDGLEKIIEEMEYHRHSRRLYVVDGENRLEGCITQKALVGHVFHYHKSDSIHARGVLEIITSESARDLMARETIHASLDEEVGEVLGRMLEKGVEEIPILDVSGKVFADLTMIDLMKELF